MPEKDRIVTKVPENTEDILQMFGGTMYNPAMAFREIVRIIAPKHTSPTFIAEHPTRLLKCLYMYT